MLKWFSGEEGGPGAGAPGSPQGSTAVASGEVALSEAAERLAQTELLVTQLKEMIRERDAALRSKDDQLKVEKEGCEAKLSKLRLQNKAKVTSLTAQLEELKKLQGGQDTPTHTRKGSADGGDQASRGKIVLLKKKVSELEQELAHREEDLEAKRKEVEFQRQRGEEMDAMLADKDRKLSEKEDYIIHLQTALAGDQPLPPAPQQQVDSGDSSSMQELQVLVQSLTKKVGEAEERYSLLQEQTDSLKALLLTEKEQYTQKENMYKQNIQTFKDIILEKDNQLTELNQQHEQELFRLAAKSDASADLEQLLKALKQKLHEKEEVLQGKNQVVDVLQGEVDGRDQQIKELSERMRRLQVERESLESKMEAEKHVMRAQLRDLMSKQQAEVSRLAEQHQAQMEQTQQELLGQLEEMRSRTTTRHQSATGDTATDPASAQRLAELEAQAKQSEAKFLKTKAWSKTRIRQLEEELRKSQGGGASPDVTALRSRVTELEEEREESMWKLEQYDELKAKNDLLEAKLVVYEEQQRTLQAELEQVTKRAASQASESGSADDTRSQVLEWQEMVSEAVSVRDRAQEEKAALSLRLNHMEEEREALVTRQQELEEELAQARGPTAGRQRPRKHPAPGAQRSLQEDFELDRQPGGFQDPRSSSESTTPMEEEGENMGDGLRSVVEELELERNQLQEQIVSLEERCQDLEDRVQLQHRIETLQSESERLQSQLASVRAQQSRDAEKHMLQVTSLNQQLQGLTDTQECLESSLIEKENTLAKTSEKLELINSLRDSITDKENQYKEVSDKLLQTEHNLLEVSKKCSAFEKQCSELKTDVADLTQKLVVLREKTQKQEVTVESLQTELDHTNDELDKLNSTHLEERAQLIHDLQSCEREIDCLKDALSDREKEISTLCANLAEYTEQITALKQDIKLKEEHLIRTEGALSKAEREAKIMRESQDSDHDGLNEKITDLVEKLKDAETETSAAKEERDSKAALLAELTKQAKEDKKTIHALREELQKESVSHRNDLSECKTLISSLKEQLTLSTQKLQQEAEGLRSQLGDQQRLNETLQEQLHNKEQTHEKELKSSKEEQNRLIAEVAKYTEDVQKLSKLLEENIGSEELIKKSMQEKQKTIESLEQKLRTKQEEYEDERLKFTSQLKARDEKNANLGKEIQNKSENISKLKNLCKNMKTEKQQLQESLKKLTVENESQKQNVEQLNEKVTITLQLNNSLETQVKSITEENQRLQLDLAERTESIAEIVNERELLQSKISALEMQHSENTKRITELQQDKEELCTRTSELNRTLEQSAQSISETLVEKTNECRHLSQLLSEKEEKVTRLQEQAENMTSQVNQLQHSMEEKEHVVTDLQAEVESKQNQQMQLQETLSLLQEQACTLKSGLLEKDIMLKQKEDEYSTLQNENSQLHHQSQEREAALTSVTQECQNYKDELNKLNESVISLSGQRAVIEESAVKLESEKAEMNTRLEECVRENTKMRQDLEQRQADTAVLHNHIQALTEQNHQLRAAFEIREKELAQQMNLSTDLEERLKLALEQNSGLNLKVNSLTEHKQRLQEELAQKAESLSEITAERNSLQEKVSGFEMQHLENRKIIEGLLKDKEQLTIAVGELNTVLETSKQAVSENLMEKTTECINLSRAVREREEQAAVLQEQLDSLYVQIKGLTSSVAEKEKLLSEQVACVEAQQAQLVQLQETVSLLQEQGCALKSGLMEKDTMFLQKSEECSSYQKEVLLQKDLLSKTQGETESLRAEISQLSQQMAEKEQALGELTQNFQNQNDELTKQTESVFSLSNQLGVMNENVAKMEVEISNLTSELKNSMVEQSKALEEIASLKTAVCDRDKQLSSLEQELNATSSDKERLCLTVQEKDTSLRQQESLIQQLQTKSVEVESQASQQFEIITQLQNKIDSLEKSIQEKDALREQVEKELQENFSSEKKHFENQLDSNAEIIMGLQSEVNKCNLRYSEQEVQIRQQVDNNASLRSQVSALGGQVDRLTSESNLLKETLKEKDQLIILSQDTSAVNEHLNSQLQAKEAECDNVKEQLAHLQESLDKATGNLQEKQIAFASLKEKYASHLEELQEVRKQLSQKTDEVSDLRKALDENSVALHTAEGAIETLRKELSLTSHELQETQELKLSISKQKEEALASHHTSVSSMTVEIERLKSQHLHVAAQMNALTENLEQREMALHAINNQYTAQVKNTANLVSELQKLEDQNKRLNEEVCLLKQEHQMHMHTADSEKAHLQQEMEKLVAEKDELGRRHEHHIRASEERLQLQALQQSSNVNEITEKMMAEKERLQAEVSVKGEEITGLKANIHKIEHILQDSEKEWLLVLDRETQDKNLLAERLKSVENEMKSKDCKVSALKQDLDNLQEKLEEAASAIRQGSDQLKAKELEASSSRVHLEKILSSVQEKDSENLNLQQALQTMENELQRLNADKKCTDEDLLVMSQTMSQRLIAVDEEKQAVIKQIQERHLAELNSLRDELLKGAMELQESQCSLNEEQASHRDKCQQITLLQEQVKHLHTQLQTESEKLKEAANEQSSLHNTVQSQNDQISCMSIQISQQKELLTGLSQQLRDKDASIAQVMESVSSERTKLTEEKNNLIAQLESTENINRTSVIRLEDISQQLEQRVSLCQSEIETKTVENCKLSEENGNLKGDLAKLTKEKEALKKKLQAALLVRKDLLKKMEEQKEESANNVSAVSDLQERLKEMTSQTQAAEKDYQDKNIILEKTVAEKEGEIDELKKERECLKRELTEMIQSIAEITVERESLQNKTSAFETQRSQNSLIIAALQQDKETLCITTNELNGTLEHLKKEKHILQATLNEREVSLAETLRILDEKSTLIEQLRLSISEREAAFEHDRREMMHKLSELQNALEKSIQDKDAVREQVEEELQGSFSSEKMHFEKQLDSNAEIIMALQSEVNKCNLRYSEQEVQLRQQADNNTSLKSQVSVLEISISTLRSQVDSLTLESNMLKATLKEKEELIILSQNMSVDNEHLSSTLQAKEAECESVKKQLAQLELTKVQDVSKTDLASTIAAVDLENELLQLKQEKAVLQKKTHAALLARKEMMKKSQETEKKLIKELSKLKDDYKTLVEQHSQQTNELNAVQMKFDEKVKELEDFGKTSLSQFDEIESLRRQVDEKNTDLHNLKTEIIEKDQQYHSLVILQTELETAKSILENMCSEALVALDHMSHALHLKLNMVEEDLAEACRKLKYNTKELAQRYNQVKLSEQKHEQEKKTLMGDNMDLQCQLRISQTAMEELKNNTDAQRHELEQNIKFLIEENKSHLEQIDVMKVELDTALASVSQKSSEIQSIENTLAETQKQLDEERHILSKELEKEEQHCAETESNKLSIELLQQEKEDAFRFVDQLRDEISKLNAQLREAEELNQQMQQITPVMHDGYLQQEAIGKEEAQSILACSKELEINLKEEHNALLRTQSLVSEKEELIAALEQQLQRQIHLHEVAMEKMRVEVADLQQKSREDGTKMNEHDNQSKLALLTKKLQAALISRKDLLKENATLKDKLESLAATNEEKVAESLAMDLSVSELKQKNVDLLSAVSSLTTEKDKLKTEVERILNDNLNLSAACESLKQTIENITQQKQAFSCQLESLKHSETEELSEWKSKHAELKQEYESLLQAYENVSSEMDKMRQLLEAVKRERQEALFKVHKLEAAQDNLEKHAREVEEENDRLNDKLNTFPEGQQRIEQLELENCTIKQDLMVLDEKQKVTVNELTIKNQQMEVKIHNLNKSSEELRQRLTEIQTENKYLSGKLSSTSCSLEELHFETKSCEDNMQRELDKALNLNNSLTAQIEAQKTELGAQQEISDLWQKEKKNLSARFQHLQNDLEVQLGEKNNVIKELQDIINKHSQETISLNEKVKILEDDKSLLQEELENVQEISDKVKNENEYLETMTLKNSERIDELTESVNLLQTQNVQLSSQLVASKARSIQVCQEKEQYQLKLVKEFEEKLKIVKLGNEGSTNVKKELRELLKEKHLELNQLQHDCIKYQELILDLESSEKNSQAACEQLEKQLKQSSEKITALIEKNQQLEADLRTQKNLLKEATETIVVIQSERDQLVTDVSQKSMSGLEVITERIKPENVDDQQEDIQMENQILQQKIDELQDLKEQERQAVADLRQKIDSQDLQINTLKRQAETNAAKLSALSSTPQGADVAQQWDVLFQNALHEKDNQLLEQGVVIKRFLEDMRLKEKETDGLREIKSRLERALNEYSVAEAAHQRQLYVMSARNTELTQTVEIMNAQFKELRGQVDTIERERRALSRELADNEDVASQMQFNLQQLENSNSDMEAQLLLSQSHYDRLQVDFEKQQAICLHLKSLLQNKDSEISSLLTSRDGQISGYLEQLQANHHAQVANYEDRLTAVYYEREKTDKELRILETKVKTLQNKLDRTVQEKEHVSVQMDSLRNSMVSLQTEREQLMSEYRLLEARNEIELSSRNDSAKGEVDATKGLKFEIRKLLHQMDDLNSENAMLRAQLVRYREDLNQVLSLKDNQLKELLKKQQDMIKTLENQKAAVEKQHRECLFQLRKEEEVSNTLNAEASALKAQVTKLEADMLAMKTERAETSEGKVIADLQAAVMAKAAECNNLQQKLFAQKVSSDDLKEKLLLLENETDKKLADADDKYNSELDAFERESDLMRNQRETADQRVAELAKDLLQVEQLLSEATSRGEDMKAQNDSLGRAMAALQNDRDQLIEDFKILRNRYDEELRETQVAMTKVERHLQDATSELAALTKERQILVHKMAALESKQAQSELTKLVDELATSVTEKEKEMTRFILENDAYRRQVSAFSRSMASLQNDRDRLMDELAANKRVVESRQGSGGPGPEEPDISSADASQKYRDGLQMKHQVEALQRALQEAEAHRLQTETDATRYQAELAELRADRNRLHNECKTLQQQAVQMKTGQPVKETMALSGQSGLEELVARFQAERVQLHSDLQRCLYEIQQRDQLYQQLNAKMEQTLEEKGSVAAQLRAVSQTLRDTQTRCHWLESQLPGQQGGVSAEVAPGAPQEKSSHRPVAMETTDASQLRDRLMDLEQSLSEERSRREAAEEALGLLGDHHTTSAGSSPSRGSQQDYSIQMETEDEWEALILNPNQPLITRKVKGGLLACRRWIRGRSLYCSKQLTTRARSRYFFLAYLLTLHVLVLMCLGGAL